MRARHAAFLFTTLILALLVVNSPFQMNSPILVRAQSPPPLPMLYTGNVTLNGSPAPDGLNVTAVDSGVVVGSGLTSGGAYSLSACSPENCNSGDTLSFMLNGQLAAAETVAVDTSQRWNPANPGAILRRNPFKRYNNGAPATTNNEYYIYTGISSSGVVVARCVGCSVRTNPQESPQLAAFVSRPRTLG